MKKYFELSIHNPCSEKLESFTPTERGSFCKSCQKEVIDFSKMTDIEIRNYFKTHSEEKTCGQFLPAQLKAYQLHQSNFSSINKFWAAGALGLATTLLNTNKANAQETNTKIEVLPQETEKVPLATNSVSGVKKVSGIVTAEGIPLPGVAITLKGTNLDTATDLEGKYTFPALLKEGDELVFYYTGYKIQNYIVNASEKSETQLERAPYQKLNIKLQPSALCIRGEVAVTSKFKSKKSYWKKRNKKD